MMKKTGLSALVAASLAVGGFAYTQLHKPAQVVAEAYTCPLTGEELPCPNCCPLNQQK